MMEVCYNNNNNNGWTRQAQRKPKNFRFQVIEVHNSPKWFVWPSRKGSIDCEDENHNANIKTENSAIAPSSTPAQAFVATSSTQSSAYSTASNASNHQINHNGYGSVRRSLVRRRNGEVEPTSLSVPPRCAACHCEILSPDRPRLESPVRKLSFKKDKAMTEPLSASMPTFQILSIEKKWESFDVTDDELEEVLPLDETRRWTTQ